MLQCEDLLEGSRNHPALLQPGSRVNQVIKEASASKNGHNRTETPAIKLKGALIQAYTGIVVPPVNQEHL